MAAWGLLPDGISVMFLLLRGERKVQPQILCPGDN